MTTRIQLKQFFGTTHGLDLTLGADLEAHRKDLQKRLSQQRKALAKAEARGWDKVSQTQSIALLESHLAKF